MVHAQIENDDEGEQYVFEVPRALRQVSSLPFLRSIALEPPRDSGSPKSLQEERKHIRDQLRKAE
jgi:hypothetical protein